MTWRVRLGSALLYCGPSAATAHATSVGTEAAELRVLLPGEDTWREVPSMLWLVLLESPGAYREPTLDEVQALLPHAGWRVETSHGPRVVRVEPMPAREGWRLRVSCDAGTDLQHLGDVRATRREAEGDRRLWLAQTWLAEVEPRH